jgi:uncharacterized protein involved in outer membrane biogenesis
MKKWFFRLLLALIVLLVLGLVAAGLFLDGAVKSGIEMVGSRLTKVQVELHSVRLSLFSGSGKIEGLVVANPPGFKTPSAINVGTASLALEAKSLLTDKVIIKSIEVEGPEITFDTDLKSNNLSTLLANLKETSGGTGQEPATASQKAKESKKLEVDEFLIRGAKIRVSLSVLGGKSGSKGLPEIRLHDLGKGPEGITAAELTRQVLEVVLDTAAKEASTIVADLGKGALYMGQDVGNSATNSVNKATKGVLDFLKKK